MVNVVRLEHFFDRPRVDGRVDVLGGLQDLDGIQRAAVICNAGGRVAPAIGQVMCGEGASDLMKLRY